MTSGAEFRSFLRELVLFAGREVTHARKDLNVTTKGPVDLVTEVDLRIEEILVESLRQRFPDWSVFSEEGSARDVVEGKDCWYVDPLDGTTNFVHGHPFHAISIGGWRKGTPVAGVVYAPALDELFLATRGEGASLENPRKRRKPHPLRLRPCDELKTALLATGFPYRRDSTCRMNLRCVAEALTTAQGVRRGGSAALDLCYLAAGRLDGFWEATLKPWDVAAGALIAQEAGARVSDYRGENDFLWGGRIAAAGPALHPQLLGMLRDAHQEPERWPLGEPHLGPVPLHPSSSQEDHAHGERGGRS